MSKQTSIVKFKGTIDGISFYEQGEVTLARKATGPSKERIMNDPVFQRTRENIAEFGGLAMGVSFYPAKNLCEGKTHARQRAALKVIKDPS